MYSRNAIKTERCRRLLAILKGCRNMVGGLITTHFNPFLTRRSLLAYIQANILHK